MGMRFWGWRATIGAGVAAVLAGMAFVLATAPQPVDDEPSAIAAELASAPDEPTASELARSEGERVEVAELTNETDQVFANPDGTFTLEQAVAPVRAQDLDGGGWTPIDTTLEKRADGTIGPAVTVTEMSFSGGGSTPLARMGAAGRELRLSTPFPLPEPTLAGDTATYAAVLPGVDLTVTADALGFTHHLVVKDRAAARNPALDRLMMPLEADGLEVHTNAEGMVEARDHAGAVVFTTTAASMWDSPDGRPARREARVGVEVGEDALTLVPDQALLDDPATQFPVVIDPAWTTPRRTGWAVVRKSHPNSSYWMRTSANDDGMWGPLKVGHVNDNGTHYVDRTLLNFDPRGLHGARIISAQLQLYEKWSSNCTATPTAVHLTSGASPSNTWNSQPSWGEQFAAPSFAFGWTADRNPAHSPCRSNWAPGLNVTKGFQYAADKKWTALGLGVKATNESNTAYTWKRFGDGTNDWGIDTTPRVIVNYNRVPNPPYGLRTDQDYRIPLCRWCGPGVLYVSGDDLTLYAKVNDPDAGDTVRMAFDYWGHRSGVCGYTAAQKQNTEHSCKLDLKLWANGQHIGWRARGFNDLPAAQGRDGANTNAPVIPIIVDREAPTEAPSVDSGEYPRDGEWHGGPTTEGTFTFGANGVTDVDHFQYGWDDQTSLRADAEGGLSGDASVKLTPPSDGPVTMYVRSVDRAGNQGPIERYRFYVHAGPSESPGDYASGAGRYVPVQPQRIVPRRTLAAGATFTFSPLGQSGIPAEAGKVQALVYNLTAFGPNGASGKVVATPAGTTSQSATVLYSTNRYLPTLATTALGTDGQITLTNLGNAPVDVFVDVQGFYTAARSGLPGATYVPLDPERVVNGQPVGRTETWTFSPLGQGGIPAAKSDVAAVAFTLIVNSAGSGHVTVHPGGTPYPGVSNINHAPADARARYHSNHVVTGLGDDGTVSITTSSTADLRVWVDIHGYYATPSAERQGGVFRPVTPVGIAPGGWPIAANSARPMHFAGRYGIPSRNVSAVAIAAHVKPGASATGALEIWPNGGMVPDTVHYATDGYRTVQLNAQVDPSVRTTFYNYQPGGSGISVWVDVVGYFLDPAAADRRSGEWRFDDSEAPGEDASGHGHDLTLRNDAAIGAPGHGDAGQALQLANGDGDLQHASTEGTVVRTDRSFTVAAWLKPDEIGGFSTAVAQDGSRVSGFYLQLRDNGHWAFAMPPDDKDGLVAVRAESSDAAKPGEWAHVAGVRDVINGEIRLYVNGKLEATTPYAPRWNSGGALTVGRALFNGSETNFWPGVIDEVRVWPQAVAAEEIRRAAGVDSALFAHWRLDATGDDETGARPAAASAAGLTYDGGHHDQAAVLDGKDGELSTRGPGIATNESFSVSAWVKPAPEWDARPDEDNDFGAAVSQDGTVRSGFELGFDPRDDKWKFGMAVRDDETGDVRWVTAVAELEEGDGARSDGWTHLVGVFNAETRTLHLYVDGGVGESIEQVTNTWNATGGVRIGRGTQASAPAHRWWGGIDDVRLYSGALTPEAVGAIYEEISPA